MWIKQLDDYCLSILNNKGERIIDTYDLNSALVFIKNHKGKENDNFKSNFRSNVHQYGKVK